MQYHILDLAKLKTLQNWERCTTEDTDQLIENIANRLIR